MKHLLLLWVFIVSWNEYELKSIRPCPEPLVGPNNTILALGVICTPSEIYTVELTTYTIKLATQGDVDLFVGTITIGGFKPYPTGIINKDAFNIQVKKEK